MDKETKRGITWNLRFIFFLEYQYIFLTAVRVEGSKNGYRWQRWAFFLLLIYFKMNFWNSWFLWKELPQTSLFLLSCLQYVIFFCYSNTTDFLRLSYKLSWVTSPILHRYHPIMWWWLPNLYPQTRSLKARAIIYYSSPQSPGCRPVLVCGL